MPRLRVRAIEDGGDARGRLEEPRLMMDGVNRDEDSFRGVASGSPERFGYEWQSYSEVLPEHEEQFRRWAIHLTPEEWRGKTFLDVGCGMSRNSYWPLSYGASTGVAI